MNKALLVSGLAIVVVAGYSAGTVLTGQQVNKEYQRYVQLVAKNYQGIAEVTSSIESSLFSSHNTLSLEFSELPVEVAQWAQTNTITFDVDYSHSFLASSSVMKISAGELLEKIKMYQVNPTQDVFSLTSNYRYDMFESTVHVTGDLESDALKIESQEANLNIGSSSGAFSIAGENANIEWQIQPSIVDLVDANFELGKISIDESLTALSGDVLSSEVTKDSVTKLLIDRILIDDVRANTTVELQSFEVDVSKSQNDTRALFFVDYRSASIAIKGMADDFVLEKPELKLALDLDSQALKHFVQSVNAQTQQNNGSISNPETLVPMLSKITEQGIKFDIEKLAISSKGETIEGLAKLQMAPFVLAEIQLDRQAVLKKLDLNAELTIPKKFLEMMPGYNAQQFGFFVGMGFLLELEDAFKVNLVAKEGVVKLNGNPLPVF